MLVAPRLSTHGKDPAPSRLERSRIWPQHTHTKLLRRIFFAQEERTAAKLAKLKDLQTSLADTQPVGSLVSRAKTMDQARAILTFVEVGRTVPHPPHTNIQHSIHPTRPANGQPATRTAHHTTRDSKWRRP